MEANYFGKYTLSDETIEKLRSLRNSLKGDLDSSNSTWKKLFKFEEKEEVKENNEDVPMEIDNEPLQKSQLPETDDMTMPSTQFYFSQTKHKENRRQTTKQTKGALSDVTESLYISLERSNGFLDSEDMKHLTDANAVEIIENLSQRLSPKGIYNLCCTICDMEETLGTYYARIICTNLLLKKIIDMESAPDRIELLTITKIAVKFPDEVRQFLLVPLLNADLKNTNIILTLIKSYPEQSKTMLITDFIETVKELQMWHITILPFLIDVKIEDNAKTGILTLFVDKALNYADDKNYSQCILSFIKKHAPFTEEQKNMLHEIIIVHKTIFKKPMQNIFDKMFFHRDLWHIS